MANKEHLDILRQGVKIWNRWRKENPRVRPDLRGAQLSQADLSGAILDEANLYTAKLWKVSLQGASLCGAALSSVNLNGANLRSANLTGANLRYASLVGADLMEASISNSLVYGVSIWNLKGRPKDQSNLIITSPSEPTITVDNLEVAQFVYLLLNNEKIRDVITTIGQKAVLILGRFIPERKRILDTIADALRGRGYLPIIFDFEKSQERDFSETIKILAGLSLFIIADMTNPKSNPLELQATVPDYMIPFVPIIQEGENPFSMFVDLQRKYTWVLPVLEYDTKENLLAALDNAIIRPALEKHDELVERRTEDLKVLHIRDFLTKQNRA